MNYNQENYMGTNKIIAIVLFIAAGVAGFMGHQESQGLASSLSSALDGNPGDNVMIKYIAAAVLTVGGIVLLKK